MLVIDGGEQPLLVVAGLNASGIDDGEGSRNIQVGDRNVKWGVGPGGEGGGGGGGDVLGWDEWVRGWGD